MGEETRISELLEELNKHLNGITPYKLALVDPAAIQPVEKNAHFMPKKTFDQLVSNIKADKNLSTLPFCWRDPKGVYIVLSGNHRVMAAKEAGIKSILVLYTDEALSKSEQISIQLSHNALVGQDNPTLLLELWNEIDTLQLKMYSGLDDNLLKTLVPVNIIRLNEEPLRLEELKILFIPAEIARMEEIAKKIGPISRKRFVAMAQEFDPFFEALLKLKEAQGIVNTATAFMLIADIVEEWIAARPQEAEAAKTEHNGVEKNAGNV